MEVGDLVNLEKDHRLIILSRAYLNTKEMTINALAIAFHHKLGLCHLRLWSLHNDECEGRIRMSIPRESGSSIIFTTVNDICIVSKFSEAEG